MMQVTRAAFPAQASLNKQATDPKSHTPVGTVYTRFSPFPLPAKFRWQTPARPPFLLQLLQPQRPSAPISRFVCNLVSNGRAADPRRRFF